MRALLVGSREVQNQPMDYYLLAEDCNGLCESYGVEISCVNGEDVSIPGITLSQKRISGLITLLMKCAVTPVALRDVIEDWLLQ